MATIYARIIFEVSDEDVANIKNDVHFSRKSEKSADNIIKNLSLNMNEVRSHLGEKESLLKDTCIKCIEFDDDDDFLFGVKKGGDV